jgi:hypothetical protein
MALEALEKMANSHDRFEEVDTAIAAVKLALSAPVQKPVFKVGTLVTLTECDYPGLGQWFVQLWDGEEVAARVYGDDREAINLRIAALNNPPAAVPLTYEQITAISKQVGEGGPKDSIDRFVRAIEAAHGITKGQP